MKKQRGFIWALLPLYIGFMAASGVIGYSMVNATQHPEVSKAGRS